MISLSEGKNGNKSLSALKAETSFTEKLANQFKRSAEQSKWEGAEVSWYYGIMICSGKQQPKGTVSRSRTAAKEQ